MKIKFDYMEINKIIMYIQGIYKWYDTDIKNK